ncbi:MAG: glycosyltransferase family 4 protein [Negativicutes bacterium]|jgi:glycosyltransferase involved in cell wall biosynthesis
MKICYIITTSEFGGATKNVYYLAKHFAKQHEVHVIAGDRLWLADEAEAAGFVFHQIPTIIKPISPLKDGLAIIATIKLFSKIKPDIVHCHSSKTGLIGRVSAKVLLIPTVFTAHGWATLRSYGKLKTWLYLIIEKFAAYLTDCMVCISTGDLQLAKKMFACKRFELVYNGIPDTEFLATRHDSARPLKLCMVARFAHPKTPGIVVAALEKLLAQGTIMQLTLIGGGPDIDKMKNQFDKSSVAKEIKFFGETAYVERELLNYDVFVLSTIWEGLPISIIEAMRAGLPVVASNVGGNSDLIVDEVTGYLFESGDVDKLAEILNKINCNRGLLQQLGNNGRRRYHELFTEKVMLEKTVKIYETVLR